MSLDGITSLVSRLATVVAVVFVGLAGLELLANLFNQTILRQIYTPGRLLEFAAILILFVIAVLLRQLRNEVRASRK